MNKDHQPSQASLSQEDILLEVIRRLKRYENLNFLEKFAMFMGISQVIEISLKQLLHRKYEVDYESIEHLTLGQITGRLKDRGLRADFIKHLESVVQLRNHIAHSLLANQIMLYSLVAGDARFEERILEKAIIELEQLWFLFEWTEAHDAWG